MAMDQFIASRMKVAFASQLDRACLYGAGPPNESLGVINASGSQLVPVATPPVWNDLALMRYLSINCLPLVALTFFQHLARKAARGEPPGQNSRVESSLGKNCLFLTGEDREHREVSPERLYSPRLHLSRQCRFLGRPL